MSVAHPRCGESRRFRSSGETLAGPARSPRAVAVGQFRRTGNCFVRTRQSSLFHSCGGLIWSAHLCAGHNPPEGRSVHAVVADHNPQRGRVKSSRWASMRTEMPRSSARAGPDGASRGERRAYGCAIAPPDRRAPRRRPGTGRHRGSLRVLAPTRLPSRCSPSSARGHVRMDAWARRGACSPSALSACSSRAGIATLSPWPRPQASRSPSPAREDASANAPGGLTAPRPTWQTKSPPTGAIGWPPAAVVAVR